MIVVRNSQIQEKTWDKNKVANHFIIKVEVIEQNGVIVNFEKKEMKNDINKNMSKISVLDWEIIKYT